MGEMGLGVGGPTGANLTTGDDPLCSTQRLNMLPLKQDGELMDTLNSVCRGMNT